MQFKKICIEIKLINWKLLCCYYINHFHNQQFSFWWQCGLLGRLQMECVITNIYRPVFPTCYIYNLSPHISHNFAKAIWSYHPCWLYSNQVLFHFGGCWAINVAHSKHVR